MRISDWSSDVCSSDLHQALTRARAVAGKVQIRDAFEIGRREILTQPRDARKLRHDIADMRSKMRNELDRSSDAHWDIKQGKGGLIDIEFITQYLVLRDAPRMPALVTYSDNWLQLDALAAAGSIAAGDRETLIGSYRRYRATVPARKSTRLDSS